MDDVRRSGRRRSAVWAGLAAGLSILLPVSAPGSALPAEADLPRALVAERWFRALYACDPELVRELASPDVVVTYPIFAELFEEPALRGKDAVARFAEGFCERWAEPEITVHRSLSGEAAAVLVWSFSARRTGAGADGSRSDWGGLSLFLFDAQGRMVAEVGEESAPGPMARWEEALAR